MSPIFRRRVLRAVLCSTLGLSAVASAALAQTPVPSPAGKVAAAVSPAALGQTPVLAEQVPAGALFFASWSGKSNLPKDFADTHLSMLLTALNLPTWVDEKFADLLPPAASSNPAYTSLVDLAKTIVEYAWENTSAVYSLGPGMTEQLRPEPHMCFIVRFPTAAAADAAERDIQDRITAIAGGEAIPNIRLFRNGTTLAFSANDAVDKSPLDPIESPLSTEARFADSVQRNAAPGGVTLYVNLERAWSLADENNLENPDYERNLKILGLKAARSILLSAAPDGKDWGSNVFVSMDPNRTGILGALTTTRPTDPAVYKGVPRSATSVSVVSLDFNDILTRAKTEGETFQKGLGQQVEAVVGMAGGFLNVNVAELFGSMGTDYALFALPTTGPSDAATPFDFLLVSKPKNPAKVDLQLWGLAQGLNRFLVSQGEKMPKLNLVRGDITSVELPDPAGKGAIFSPTWAIKDGYLLMGASKDTVARAISEIVKGTLADSDVFSAAKARLRAPAIASYGYSDISQTLAPMYDAWAFTANLAGNALHPNFKKLPVPTRAQLAPHSTTIVSANWVDDAGLHYRSIAPYPAADAFSSTFALVAGKHSLPITLPSLAAKLNPNAPK